MRNSWIRLYDNKRWINLC